MDPYLEMATAEEIADLKKENDLVQGQLELRSKRFAGFMHALHDVSMVLEEEASAEVTPMSL